MNQIITLQGFDDTLVHFETLVKNLRLIGFILLIVHVPKH